MTARISGHTRIIAHIGVPTEGFRAPLIYNPYFAARGIDVTVVPMGCEAGALPALLAPVLCLRNAVGALITMPHKTAVVPLLHATSAAVDICGACNAVKRDADGWLVGDMFDGAGFVRAAQRHGRAIAGASALVVGAGGVGSAIAASLVGAGLVRLGLYDSHPPAAEALAARLRRHAPALAIATGANDPAGYDMVVNATPLGGTDADPLPVDATRIAPSAFVGDVVLRDGDTPLLSAARTAGCTVQAGTDMLYEMIPAYLDFFNLPRATADELRAIAES